MEDLTDVILLNRQGKLNMKVNLMDTTNENRKLH